MSKKRCAGSQVTKDNPEETCEEETSGPMPLASAEELKQRKILRVKRGGGEPKSTGGLFASINTSMETQGGKSGPSFASLFGGAKKEGAAAPTGFAPPLSAPAPLLGGASATPAANASTSSSTSSTAATTPSEKFNFTDPPSAGKTFAPPATGAFPPLKTFDSQLTALQPPASPATPRAGDGFGAFGSGENTMAKVASSTPGPATPTADGPASTEATTPFTPAVPSYVQPEASKLLGDEPTSPQKTGEENDLVIARYPNVVLRELRSKEWVERGTGVLKINKPQDGGKCRMLMRRDATQQVVLNELLVSPQFMLAKCEKKMISFTVFDPSLTQGEKVSRTYCLCRLRDAEALNELLKKAISGEELEPATAAE